MMMLRNIALVSAVLLIASCRQSEITSAAGDWSVQGGALGVANAKSTIILNRDGTCTYHMQGCTWRQNGSVVIVRAEATMVIQTLRPECVKQDGFAELEFRFDGDTLTDQYPTKQPVIFERNEK